MARFYRLSIGESWFDGDSWSVNEWFEQPYIVQTDEKNTCKSIIQALKKGGLLYKNLRYSGWDFEFSSDEQDIYIERYWADNKEPIMLKLNQIAEADLERELNSHYGFRHVPTIVCKA